MPAGYLLDLDGTLIDSEPWYKRTEVNALNSFGVPMTLDDMEEFTGLTLPVWLNKINARFETSLDVTSFLASYQPQMESHVRQNIEMFPDATTFLDEIAGVPAVLVTSSMKWYVDAVMERFPKIAGSVQAVVCEADVRIGKPDPEPYLLGAAALGVEPGSCWVFEDALNGVRSGVSAGCHVIAVDRHGSGQLGMAHRVVASLAELTPVTPP